MTSTVEENRFPLSARLALLFSLALVLGSSAQLLYRFFLPTDGWSIYTTELENPDWIYDRNLVGAQSLLEQEDDLLDVDGLHVAGTASNQPLAAPENWTIGQTVKMTVLRDQQEISFDIPVVKWTLAAWWQYNIADIEHMVSFLGTLILFTTGSFTFYKRKETPSAQALLVVLFSGGSGTFGWLGTMGMLFLAILSLVHSGFTQRDAVSRAQLRWAVGGILLGLVLALMSFPVAFGWISNPFLIELMGEGVSLGFTVIGISLAVAVLRYRLYDIDVLIRRTLVYSILTAILALVYLGGVTLLQGILSRISGEQSTAAIVISTLAIAALFNPLRFRIQSFIDHRFFRRKYDAEKTLASFSTHLREEVNLDDLSTHITSVVEETFQPAHVSVYLLSSRSAATAGNSYKRLK